MYLSACIPLLLSCTNKISNPLPPLPDWHSWSFCVAVVFIIPVMWRLFLSHDILHLSVTRWACANTSLSIPDLPFLYCLIALQLNNEWLCAWKKIVFTARHVKGRKSECIGLCKPGRSIQIPLLNKGYVSCGRRHLKPIALEAGGSVIPCIWSECKIPSVVLTGLRTIFICLWWWYSCFLNKVS